jgi:hypothetical protein
LVVARKKMKKVLIVGVNHCWQQLPEVSLGSPSMDDPSGIPREITDDEFADFDGFIRATI